MEIYAIIIVLSIALAMDSFAVSMSMGMGGSTAKTSNKVKVALSFGIAEGIVFFIGASFAEVLTPNTLKLNAMLACGILVYLGVKMFIDGLKEHESTCEHLVCNGDSCKEITCLKTGKLRELTFRMLLIFALATSIDALAGGLSYGLLYNTQIAIAAICVAIAAIGFSFVGVFFGSKLESIIGNKANLFGGIVLIILGIIALF